MAGGGPAENCRVKTLRAEHVTVALAPTLTLPGVDLAPLCRVLALQPSEARGRVLGLSALHGRDAARFEVESEQITFTNRLNQDYWFKRFKFVPVAPARTDVRVFLLLAGSDLQPIPDANLTTSTEPSACLAPPGTTPSLCVLVQVGEDFYAMTFASTASSPHDFLALTRCASPEACLTGGQGTVFSTASPTAEAPGWISLAPEPKLWLSTYFVGILLASLVLQ